MRHVTLPFPKIDSRHGDPLSRAKTLTLMITNLHLHNYCRMFIHYGRFLLIQSEERTTNLESRRLCTYSIRNQIKFRTCFCAQVENSDRRLNRAGPLSPENSGPWPKSLLSRSVC